ncbi:sialic acid-binding Ig-like lectin 5 isoform X2 [Conger conger]|uniref:sialic acid-binding Ig-like lectin 5 isoform X2 n=1 Tax=Conger conger TaxID=82655 RepID=UPI002A5AAE6A|nr:sialic acid-binding Ig-like lectin 5 isoform X2 [Conger conger]
MRTQALWFYAVCCNVLNVHSTPWTLEVPQTVSAVKGSCVVVPCKFNYPGPERKADLTGKWHMTSHDHIVYHPEPSKVMGQFRGRTDLVGDLARNNCSLIIKSLEKNDKGPFIFRIEISKLDKYSYTEYQVSIDVQDAPATPMLSVSREVKAGEAVTATCTASHSCPTDLPHLVWSHTGTPIVQSEALSNGQWRVTSNLTFTATPSDHGRHLVCTAQYQQNKKVQCEKSLIVKYAPVNVEVETKSTVVKEGDAVKMQCSSESNPPAHSYQWYNITGALLSEEKIYKLDNVSRHISAFYCAANNTEGHRNSIPVKFRVEYPPRIGVESVCTAKITGVHCRCLVESSPTSRVQWILAGTVVNNSTVNSTGAKDSGTLHILHLPLGLTDMVSCNASNIHGNDILALQTNQRGVLMAIYLSGSAASAFVLIASILVLWKCSRRKKCVETRNNLYITASLDGKRPSKDLCALEVDDDIYVNCGKTHFQDEEEEQHYGNCCQEDIYANM